MMCFEGDWSVEVKQPAEDAAPIECRMATGGWSMFPQGVTWLVAATKWNQHFPFFPGSIQKECGGHESDLLSARGATLLGYGTIRDFLKESPYVLHKGTSGR